MGGKKRTTAQSLDLEIVPAILVKTKEEFLEHVNKIRGHTHEIHIDVMDNKFVPNSTFDPSRTTIPNGANYEFHWMVEEPETWIEKMKGDYLHQIHVETIKDWKAIKEAVKKSGGRLCIAISPDTPVNKIKQYLKEVERVLVMCVVPGYSHQKYIESMEEKIGELRESYPELEIEVDGGINFETIKRASKAGANRFVSCSAIFSSQNPKETIEKLKRNAYEARGLNYG